MATNQADLVKFVVKWGLISVTAIYVATIFLILFFLSDKEIKYDSTAKKKVEVENGE